MRGKSISFLGDATRLKGQETRSFLAEGTADERRILWSNAKKKGMRGISIISKSTRLNKDLIDDRSIEIWAHQSERKVEFSVGERAKRSERSAEEIKMRS